MTGLEGFGYRGVYRGYEVAGFSVLRELELKAGEMVRW